jgi:MinD-like ATPase involved in chromosome partitioning or flagellar assembly
MVTASAEAPARNSHVSRRDQTIRKGQRTPATPVGLGALLAVCGLAGGAGATTLSYLIALAAAWQWSEPVLVADTGGPSGGLAACAGVEVQRSLGELAEQLAAGAALGPGVYAMGHHGVHVLASGPEFSSSPADAHVHRLLCDARESHGLTVIDCGTLARESEQMAAAAATHVAWVLPATARGVSRARRVLDAAPPTAGQELLVVRGEARRSHAPLRELRQIAADRHAPLVLVPHLAGLDADRLDAAGEAAQVPVQAILGALRR